MAFKTLLDFYCSRFCLRLRGILHRIVSYALHCCSVVALPKSLFSVFVAICDTESQSRCFQKVKYSDYCKLIEFKWSAIPNIRGLTNRGTIETLRVVRIRWSLKQVVLNPNEVVARSSIRYTPHKCLFYSSYKLIPEKRLLTGHVALPLQ